MSQDSESNGEVQDTNAIDEASEDDDMPSTTGVTTVATCDRNTAWREERRRKVRAARSHESSSFKSDTPTNAAPSDRINRHLGGRTQIRLNRKLSGPTKFSANKLNSSRQSSRHAVTSRRESDRRRKWKVTIRMKSSSQKHSTVSRLTTSETENGSKEAKTSTMKSSADEKNTSSLSATGERRGVRKEQVRRSRMRLSSTRRRVSSVGSHRASSVLSASGRYDLGGEELSEDGEEYADSIGSDDPSYLFDGENESGDDGSGQVEEAQPGAVFIPLPAAAARDEFGGERFLWDSTVSSAPPPSHAPHNNNNTHEARRTFSILPSVLEAEVVPETRSSPTRKQLQQNQQGEQALQDALHRYIRSQPQVSAKFLTASASTYDITTGSMTTSPSQSLPLPSGNNDDVKVARHGFRDRCVRRRCGWLIALASAVVALTVATSVGYCRASNRCDRSSNDSRLAQHPNGSSPTTTPEVPTSSVYAGSFLPTPIPRTTSPTAPTEFPTAPPTSSRFRCFRALFVGRRVTAASDLDNVTTPQHRSLRWIADDDELQLPCLSEWMEEKVLTPEDQAMISTTAALLANRVIQRYVIGTFYLATTLAARRMDRNHGLPPRDENQWYEQQPGVSGNPSSLNVHDPAQDAASVTFLNASMHECDIPRVVLCARDRLVSSIVAEKLQIHGFLPSELGSLPHLVRLILGGNELTGTLPDTLSKLDGLTALILFDNKLSGTIPEWLGDMPYLLGVDFQDNLLLGTLPLSLGKLQNLDTLQLGGNDLTGSLPSSLGNLHSLVRLSLHGNELSGPIPQWINNESFPSLVALQLNHNRLTGTIPTHLGSLTFLERLVLMRNELKGTIPPALNNLHNLRDLILAANNLTGTIPFEEAAFPYLTNLWLFRCRLSGRIPESLFTYTSLQSLMLSTNDLWGTIPTAIGTLTDLNRLELSNNLLYGNLPQEMTTMSGLVALDVSNNTLNGTLPPLFGSSFETMATLVLSENFFTGTVPATIGNMTNLQMLLLDRNPGFTGEVPATLANLHCLDFLDVHDTKLRNLDRICQVAHNVTHFHSDCPDSVMCPCCTACCNEERICYENTASPDPAEVKFDLVRGSFVDWFSAAALGKAFSLGVSKTCLGDITEMFECACQGLQVLCPFECFKAY